jgi:hypothetical protein
MPDRSSDVQLQVLEIDITPAQRKQFADSQSGSRVEESQRALPNRQLAQEQLEFRQFEFVRHLLPFRALANEFDWVSVNPLVPHRVMEDGAHQISNLRSRCFRPLDSVQPFFNGDRLYLIQSVISPTRENPDLQIAFIRGSRRERLASLILTNQLFELVMSNQFRKCVIGPPSVCGVCWLASMRNALAALSADA